MTTTRTVTPERLADPKLFADPDAVLELYRRLRKDDPLVWVEPEGYQPFWALTRYNDIRDVERQPDLFQAGPRTVLLPTKVEDVYRRLYGDPNGIKPLTHMDGEHHRLHRGVTLDWFGAKNVNSYADKIGAIAKEFVNRMEDYGGSCDFCTDVAYWFPLRVIMTLMNVPAEDEPHLLKLTQRLLSPADQIGKQKGEARSEGDAPRDIAAAFGDYFRDLTRERIRNPGDDIVSSIANARIKGEPIADHEMTSYYIILATAGHDTTAASISGGLGGLMDFPEEFAKLRGDLGLLNTAADEFIRWTAPVKHFIRTAAADVDLHGRKVAAGDSIMLCYASGCRDETVFDAPDAFRVDRPLNPAHIAFGFGPHLCLGRNLAKLDIRAFYSALLPRLRSIESDGERGYIESVFVSGLKTMPVRYRFK